MEQRRKRYKTKTSSKISNKSLSSSKSIDMKQQVTGHNEYGFGAPQNPLDQSQIDKISQILEDEEAKLNKINELLQKENFHVNNIVTLLKNNNDVEKVQKSSSKKKIIKSGSKRNSAIKIKTQAELATSEYLSTTSKITHKKLSTNKSQDYTNRLKLPSKEKSITKKLTTVKSQGLIKNQLQNKDQKSGRVQSPTNNISKVKAKKINTNNLLNKIQQSPVRRKHIQKKSQHNLFQAQTPQKNKVFLDLPNIKPQNEITDENGITDDYNNFESISPMAMQSGEGTQVFTKDSKSKGSRGSKSIKGKSKQIDSGDSHAKKTLKSTNHSSDTFKSNMIDSLSPMKKNTKGSKSIKKGDHYRTLQFNKGWNDGKTLTDQTNQNRLSMDIGVGIQIIVNEKQVQQSRGVKGEEQQKQNGMLIQSQKVDCLQDLLEMESEQVDQRQKQQEIKQQKEQEKKQQLEAVQNQYGSKKAISSSVLELQENKEIEEIQMMQMKQEDNVAIKQFQFKNDSDKPEQFSYTSPIVNIQLDEESYGDQSFMSSTFDRATDKGGNSSILSDNGKYYQMKQSRINESIMQPISETQEENSPTKIESGSDSFIDQKEHPQIVVEDDSLKTIDQNKLILQNMVHQKERQLTQPSQIWPAPNKQIAEFKNNQSKKNSLKAEYDQIVDKNSGNAKMNDQTSFNNKQRCIELNYFKLDQQQEMYNTQQYKREGLLPFQGNHDTGSLKSPQKISIQADNSTSKSKSNKFQYNTENCLSSGSSDSALSDLEMNTYGTKSAQGTLLQISNLVSKYQSDRIYKQM